MLATKTTRSTITLVCAYLVLSMTAALRAQPSEKIIWVAHFKVDCVGVGPQKCFLIKDNMYDPWKLWYDEIERLDWEEGFAYEVVVVEEPIPDPPADAPSVRLRVVELLTMINASSQPEDALPAELRDLPPPGRPPGQATDSTEEIVIREATSVQDDRIGVDPTAGSPEATEPLPEEAPPVPAVAPTTAAGEPTVDTAVESAPVPEPSPPAAPVAPVAPTSASQALPEQPPEPMTDPQVPVPVEAAADERVPTYRGHLTIGVGLETRTFKICGAEDPIWIEDRSSDNLWMRYRELSGYPNRPVFLVVEGDLGPAPQTGFGAHYEQQLVVRRVNQAMTEGHGCEEEVTDSDFIAFGNEPFWQVRISPRGIVYSTAGGADWIFPYKEPMATETRKVYWGTSADGSGHRIQVTIEEAPCRDTMADAQYRFTAAVTVDDRKLSGCARVGRE